MVTILGISAFVILLPLSLLHFYWALGGRWAFDAALPTNEQGKRVLNPKWYDSLIVGLGLMLFGIYFLVYADILDLPLPILVMKYGVWVIGLIFLLRAVGDFCYVGFFKYVRTTKIC